ncbi:MAG: MFS transporter [Pseudomonadota bacterium]
MTDITADEVETTRIAGQLKPQLRFTQILTMCFGFFGIQVGFALQTGHFSRVFETLGANVSDMAILWIAAPLTGLIVQPIVGYMSDRTWNGMGRRRPYFFWGAVLTTMGLFIMPNVSALWMAAGMLWILDTSLNITMEPFRAYVGDMMSERQRTLGYAAQSFFIGAGGTLGSALPWLLSNWFGLSSTADGALPENIQMMFYVGAVLLFIAVCITVFTGKEYDPETLAAYERAEAEAKGVELDAMVPMPAAPTASGLRIIGFCFLAAGAAFAAAVYFLKLDFSLVTDTAALTKLGCVTPEDAERCGVYQSTYKELYLLGGGLAAFGVLSLLAGLLKYKGGEQGAFSEIMEDMMRLPKTMRQLAIVQFFSWFAMFSMWIYLNRGAISHHYGDLVPLTPEYERAADWIGLLNGVYFAVAALVAFAIPVLARMTSRKAAHAVCLLVGALGFSSFIWLPNGQLLWVAMIGVGVVWASILSMPYAILSNALPANKMGIYMGIFNFFIVIPQLVAASILGPVVAQLFDGYAIYALGLGAASFVIAAGLAMLVNDPGDTAKMS